MDDLQRLLLVLGVLIAVTAAIALRRRVRSMVREIPSRYGPFPALLFFGSDSCAECRPVLAALNEAQLEFTQFTWEADQRVFQELPVDEVPRLFAVDANGRVQLDVRGAPSSLELRQLSRFS